MYPGLLARRVNPIKEILCYLPLLPGVVAEQIVESVAPLIDSNSQVRDSLFITLKKGIFSKEPQSRVISVSALMNVLKSSKPGRTEASRIAAIENNIEIFQCFRRGLSQQFEIRQQIYDGISEVVEAQPWLAPSCLDLLYPHFLKFYDSNTTQRSPLKVLHCIDSSTVVEPLSGLLHCMGNVLNCCDDNTEDADSAKKKMADVFKRLGSTEISDFNLSKNADFTAGSGDQNRAIGEIVLSVHTAMLEYVMGHIAWDIPTIMRVFKHFTSIAQILKEKAKMKSAAHFHNLKSSAAFIERMFGPQAAGTLVADSDFIKWGLNGSISLLKK
ncbi:hypothetical protein HDU76_010596, partial [Blyttiomyces sp. JEL0837]